MPEINLWDGIKLSERQKYIKKVALLPHVIRRFSVEFTCINKLAAAIKIRKETFIFAFPFI